MAATIAAQGAGRSMMISPRDVLRPSRRYGAPASPPLREFLQVPEPVTAAGGPLRVPGPQSPLMGVSILPYPSPLHPGTGRGRGCRRRRCRDPLAATELTHEPMPSQPCAKLAFLYPLSYRRDKVISEKYHPEDLERMTAIRSNCRNSAKLWHQASVECRGPDRPDYRWRHRSSVNPVDNL
jgi:hypothetical protein